MEFEQNFSQDSIRELAHLALYTKHFDPIKMDRSMKIFRYWRIVVPLGFLIIIYIYSTDKILTAHTLVGFTVMAVCAVLGIVFEGVNRFNIKVRYNLYNSKLGTPYKVKFEEENLIYKHKIFNYTDFTYIVFYKEYVFIYTKDTFLTLQNTDNIRDIINTILRKNENIKKVEKTNIFAFDEYLNLP